MKEMEAEVPGTIALHSELSHEGRSAKTGSLSQGLAARQASWALEIPAGRRITLDLTQAQQELLRSAAKHVVPSVTLVLSSDALDPSDAPIEFLGIEYPLALGDAGLSMAAAAPVA